MRYIYLTVFAVLLTVHTARAGNTTCAANTATDVLTCALENHPNVVQAKAQIPIAQINKEISSRWLNPDLDGGVDYAKADDNKGLEAQIAILQTIETPSKRKARTGKAAAEYSYAIVLTEEQKEITGFQILTILNRLRQIDKEAQTLAKAINTFNMVIKKYNNRPALSPEDKISFGLFKFALNNYEIEKNQLETEKNGYVSNLKTILNNDIKVSKKIFFYPPRSWPKIDSNGANIESIDLTKETINIDRAKADFLEAKSSSFSGVRVGPFIETRPGDFGKVDTFGLKFSVPIPIHTNSKSVEAGRMAVTAAERGYHFKKQELANTFENLKEQYQLGISSLKKYNLGTMEKHRLETEELFTSGRVSGSLLIEANRQALDNVKIYHQYELDTLQSLWKLYALQRKLITNFSEVCYEKNI